ncbi:Sel1-like repeat [Beggiatoa sp. PS]|nr:Sel1-like repeat [Beggiatoa sp. PS]
MTILLPNQQSLKPEEAGFSFEIGKLFYQGEETTQDLTLAAQLYLKAAEKGYTEAQFQLGLMYLQGKGVPQSFIQAAQWFYTAAEFGHIDAQYQLGLRYEKGEGVPQNRLKAFKWYKKAAEQGQYQAKKRIAEDYQTRYRTATTLLNQWMSEAPEDDEKVWPQIERELEQERHGL